MNSQNVGDDDREDLEQIARALRTTAAREATSLSDAEFTTSVMTRIYSIEQREQSPLPRRVQRWAEPGALALQWAIGSVAALSLWFAISHVHGFGSVVLSGWAIWMVWQFSDSTTADRV